MTFFPSFSNMHLQDSVSNPQLTPFILMDEVKEGGRRIKAQSQLGTLGTNYNMPHPADNDLIQES
jgi:hypothetical protein